MNKREVAEIRKFLKADNAVDKICCCYVSSDKSKVMMTKRNFYSVPDDDMYKYLDMFKKALSGNLGQKLHNLDLPSVYDQQHKPACGQQELLALRDCRLDNDEVVEGLYDAIISRYVTSDAYYIVLIHCVYDIPGRTSDGHRNMDASDSVYDFILCCVCPVKQGKSSLCYISEQNDIRDKTGDKAVGSPIWSFLFPAFTDRCTDIHHLLYFCRKYDDAAGLLAVELFGSQPPIPPDIQKDAFHIMVKEAYREECTMETVCSIQEKLAEMVEINKSSAEPLMLGKQELSNMLEECGATEEQAAIFKKCYEKRIGERPSQQGLAAENISCGKNIEISTTGITVQVQPAYASLIEEQVIDGRHCMVIPIDDTIIADNMEVNQKRINS